jgi:hypothetical protein
VTTVPQCHWCGQVAGVERLHPFVCWSTFDQAGDQKEHFNFHERCVGRWLNAWPDRVAKSLA